MPRFLNIPAGPSVCLRKHTPDPRSFSLKKPGSPRALLGSPLGSISSTARAGVSPPRTPPGSPAPSCLVPARGSDKPSLGAAIRPRHLPGEHRAGVGWDGVGWDVGDSSVHLPGGPAPTDCPRRGDQGDERWSCCGRPKSFARCWVGMWGGCTRRERGK